MRIVFLLALITFQSAEQSLDGKISPLLPKPEEERWLQIPWRSDFAAARAEANREGKPLFLWMMDGNPLGCTWNNGQAGRALTFADPRIAELLKRDFIPVAANTAHLAPEEKKARNWCESSRFLEKIIEKSGLRRQDESETAQGYYAFSAAGDAYGSINTHDPDEVLAILKRAKREFAGRPPAKVELKETSLGPESPVPEGALVLNVYSRIAPLPAGLDELRRRRNGQLGRDHLWLLKSDAAEVLSRLKQAKEADAPEALSRRLCRYHLTDNVRGESDLWEPENVRKRTFTMSTLAETQTSVTVRLVGAFAMLMSGIKVEGRNKRSEMGLEGTLEGVLEIDKAKGTFTGAKLYASATGWGASTFTSDEPPGRFPVKFAMVVASDAVSREVAPQGVMHSGRDEYTAPK